MTLLRNSIITTVIAIFFLLGSSQKSTAQPTNINLGPKAGFNPYTVYGGDTDWDLGMRLGIHLGGFLQYNINDMISVKPELLYTLKGARGSEDYASGSYVTRFNLHYLDAPLLLRYNTSMFYVEGGPALNLFMGGSWVTKVKPDNADNRKNKRDLDGDDFNTLGISLEGGGGVQLDNGIELGMRIDLGLTGIADDVDYSENFKNFGLRFHAAYHLF